MQVECLVFVVGVIIQITAVDAWSQIAVGRLISGFGVGALSAAVPMYQAETAPPQIRGTMTATYQLFITFGILVAYCISIGTRHMSGRGSWQTVVGIGIIWPAILAGGIQFMPESPRWLAAHGHVEKAQRALALCRGVDPNSDDYIIRKEIDEISAAIEIEKNTRAGWVDCFNPRGKMLYRTLLGMSLQSLQQLTGAKYVQLSSHTFWAILIGVEQLLLLLWRYHLPVGRHIGLLCHAGKYSPYPSSYGH